MANPSNLAVILPLALIKRHKLRKNFAGLNATCYLWLQLQLNTRLLSAELSVSLFRAETTYCG